MPDGEIMYEKRRHKRAEKKLMVHYRLLNEAEEEAVLSGRKKTPAESVDISISGMQLICDEKVNIESVIRLDIDVSGQSQMLSTFAEVRWVRPDEKTGKNRIGLEFLVIKEDHIKLIQSML